MYPFGVEYQENIIPKEDLHFVDDYELFGSDHFVVENKVGTCFPYLINSVSVKEVELSPLPSKYSI